MTGPRPEGPADSSWFGRAACPGLDTNLFFTERGEPPTQVKAVCQACPVRVDCLNSALDTGQTFGVWGGVSERGRRQLRRGRGRGSVAS